MKFDITLITTGSRPHLLEQSLRSLKENASHWDEHALTLVMDGCSVMDTCTKAGVVPGRIIVNPERQGASRSRNIGASSTPKYLRKDALMVLDDDVYCCKGWDGQLWEVAKSWPTAIVSGHAHPFNHTVLGWSTNYTATTVISSVHMLIPWKVWDAVGFFAEPGGPGGSEDVDYCNRAGTVLSGLTGFLFIISEPQCIIHTGVGSTSGSKLIGWEQVLENNYKLEKVHGIEGKVLYDVGLLA